MPSLVLGYLLLDTRVVTLIPFIDDKVLFVGDLVAGSERCRCFCNEECVSVTIAGFGPVGGPCPGCGDANGTYVLHRRGIVRPWGWGPWTWTYCGEVSCPAGEGEEEPPSPSCLEIVLTLGCSGHSVIVSFNGSVIISATVEYDGTSCTALSFTNISAEGCNPVGTIVTGAASCDEIPETRCCECPPCGTPTEWAIVDLTNGWNVLASGPVWYGGSLYAIPSPWRTRCWTTAQKPAVITVGLFVYSYPDQNPAECAVYVALEVWQVYPNKCSGGEWWDTHYWQESYPGISCDEPPEPLVTDLPTAPNEHAMNHFGDVVDCELTNMANWSNTALGLAQPRCGDRDLPDATIDVTIAGDLLGNALGVPLEVKTLVVYHLGSVGILIEVAETASIEGLVVRGCSTPCDPGCCEPQEMGYINAVGDVTIGSSGVNQGRVRSQGTVTCEGINNGGLIEADDIEFISNGENRGFLFASASVTFSGTSKNYDPVPWSDCQWFEHLSYFVMAGQVTFRDQSVNHGSTFFTNSLVSFEDDSSHAAGASTQAQCSFSDNAVNYGKVGSGSYFTYTGGTGSPSNAASGVVSGIAAFDGADNYGIVEGSAEFPNGGRNQGIVKGNGDFTQNGENNAGGVVKGNASFGGNPGVGGAFSGWNYGTVEGNAEFSSDTANYGTVNRNATFGGNSVNFGTVMGNATFNGNSSNLGTVLGTITCNTTGTCSEQ